LELEINPMTVSKAYSLLERDGIVEFVRGQGMRVTAQQNETPRSLSDRQKELLPLLRQVAAEAHLLAISPKQVRALLHGVFKELKGR
jgi:GntR family transcriptional regulator